MSRAAREMKEETNKVFAYGLAALLVFWGLGYLHKSAKNREKEKEVKQSLFQALQVDTSSTISMLQYLKDHEINKTLESNLITVTMNAEPTVWGARQNLVELIIDKKPDHAQFRDLTHFRWLLDTVHWTLKEGQYDELQKTYYPLGENKLSSKEIKRLRERPTMESVWEVLKEFFSPGPGWSRKQVHIIDADEEKKS